MSDERQSGTPAPSQKDDHKQILDALGSDDWLARLEVARQKRAKLLQSRSAPPQHPTMARPQIAAPVPPDRRVLPSAIHDGTDPAWMAREVRRRAVPLPDTDSRPPPVARRTGSRRRLGAVAILAAFFAIVGGGNMGLQTLGPSGILSADLSGGTPVRPAVAPMPDPAPQPLPAPDPPAEQPPANDPGIRLGYSGAMPDALTRLRGYSGGYVVALASPPASPPAADPVQTAPWTLDDALTQLAMVAPSGTQVHLLSSHAVTADTGGLTLIRTSFATDRNLVRYYHAQDRDLAQRSATVIGAEMANFSAYRPRPPVGTIEIWLTDRAD